MHGQAQTQKVTGQSFPSLQRNSEALTSTFPLRTPFCNWCMPQRHALLGALMHKVRP